MRQRSASRIFFGKIFGLLFFLVLLGIANLLIPYVNSTNYRLFVDFFNENLLFLITISIISLIGELFDVFIFPFNLPAPIINAVAGVMTASFIFSLLDFIGFVYGVIAFHYIWPLELLVYLIVFLVVIIAGYVRIFARLAGIEDKKWEEFKVRKESMDKISKSKGKNIEWNDVGQEFKLALYYLARHTRNVFERTFKGKKTFRGKR